MCVIVAKPKGVEMPSAEVLRRCFQSNPDGSGFMWADGDVVHVRKGYMRFDDFLAALESELPEDARTDMAVVMHFRIATHGRVIPGCCHPFPVTDDEELLRYPSVRCSLGVAHNGVIPGRETGDAWSDTMDFVAEVMAPLSRMMPDFMGDEDAEAMLEGACRSKLAILDWSGSLMTVGKFIEDEGVLYSNSSYLPKLWEAPGYGLAWDDYDEAYGESLEDLVGMLPFSACEVCPRSEECALDYPYCYDESDADEVCLGLLMEEEEEELEKLKLAS